MNINTSLWDLDFFTKAYITRTVTRYPFEAKSLQIDNIEYKNIKIEC